MTFNDSKKRTVHKLCLIKLRHAVFKFICFFLVRSKRLSFVENWNYDLFSVPNVLPIPSDSIFLTLELITIYTIFDESFWICLIFFSLFLSFGLDQDNTSLIVSIAVPFALFTAFCVVVSILYVRRKRYGSRRATKESRAGDNMSLPDSEVEISRKVYIKNFPEHFRMMSADSDFRYDFVLVVLLVLSINMSFVP